MLRGTDGFAQLFSYTKIVGAYWIRPSLVTVGYRNV